MAFPPEKRDVSHFGHRDTIRRRHELAGTDTIGSQTFRGVPFRNRWKGRGPRSNRGEPDTPPIELATQYNGPSRVLEIRFTKPLERFRTVKLELLEGIVGTDAQPLKPWTLTFSLGGS